MASRRRTRAVAFGRRYSLCTAPVGASLLANGLNTIPLTNPKSGLHSKATTHGAGIRLSFSLYMDTVVVKTT